MATSPHRITDAPEPYNSPKSDIILRSSDGVDFRFFKLLLSLASPFFSGMFDLPVAKDPAWEASSSEMEMKDGMVVVAVDENSQVLTALLGFVHPWKVPTFETLESSRVILQAADKYGMDDVTEAVEEALITSKFLDRRPSAVYALACTYKLEKAARAAAKLTLQHPMLFPFSPEVDHAPAAALYRLFAYRQACMKKVVEVTHILALRDAYVACKACPTATTLLSSVSVYQWLWDSVHHLTSRIQEVGFGGDVMQHVTVSWPVLANAMQCPTCKTKAMEIFSRFVQEVKRDIELEIRKVALEIKF
ncbi:hypothetical protein JAAARDRAFT_63196 [Jaapia argillacea MUCL 33604]|uniref:BTB domain-containing protein n=1 Tax=Jaapia argillacea MUCL 33604 TaxID=933084 RepID=A0A067P6P1_9AGAM|nr:hypothetical protein JAAARDRAFT_63196 [Jaapia argillacea MUCL 33604]